jgi:hypothetical protein
MISKCDKLLNSQERGFLTEVSLKEREQDTVHNHNSFLRRLQRCDEVEDALAMNHVIRQCKCMAEVAQ